LRALRVSPVKTADTAGAARDIALLGDKNVGALASTLAAEIYGLDVLQADLADAGHNTTRFLVFARAALEPPPGPCMTSFVFRVRNVPAALYKALGGFATNNVNMTKLESYIEGGRFEAAMFYAEVEGRPEDPPLARALEELRFFSSSLKLLGAYPADPFRRQSL
jgi:prephenate dehydratase